MTGRLRIFYQQHDCKLVLYNQDLAAFRDPGRH